MQKLLFFCLMLLCLSTVVQAQQINLTKPIVANLVDPPPQNAEKFEIKMRPVETGETPVSVSDFRITKCVVTENFKRKIDFSSQPTQDNSGWGCLMSTSSSPSSEQLNSNWTALQLKIEYSYRDAAGKEQNDKYLLDNPFNKCVRTSEIQAFIDPKVVRPAADKININASLNSDLRAKVELRNIANRLVAARQEGADILLMKGSATQLFPIVLKKVDGVELAAGNYTVEITPVNPDLKIKDGVSGSLIVEDFAPYQVRDQAAITITPDDSGNVAFTIGTTANGTMELFLNGTSIRTEPKNNRFPFNLRSNEIREGANTITLKGISDDLVELSGNPTFSFVKDSKTYLDPTTISFNLDENDVLTINYKLTKKIDNRWQFVDPKGKIGLGEPSEFVERSGSGYIAKINLRVQSKNFLDLLKQELKGDGPTKTAPLVIQIASLDGRTAIGAFKIDFLKPDQKLIDGLKQIIAKIKTGGVTTPKTELKTLLGADGTTEVVESVFRLIKEQNPSTENDTKKVIFKVLAVAGKFAAGYFGIPLPF